MTALVLAPLTPRTLTRLLTVFGWEAVGGPDLPTTLAELSPADRREVNLLVVEADRVGRAHLRLLPNLQVIGCVRSDPVNIDTVAASERDIPVLYTPRRNAAAVADFTLGLCLAALRGIATAHNDVVSGALTAEPEESASTRERRDVIWMTGAGGVDQMPYVIYRGRELSSINVGIVGFGQVGREVTARLRHLVKQIWVCDPAASPEEIQAAGGRAAELDELLANVDLISLHARSNALILGRDELRRLKAGSYVINTARATLLDYEALADALWDGHLRGAALDVFPEEPLRTDSRLLDCPHLTLTPHIAGATEEVITRHSEILWDALRSIYEKEDWSGIPVFNPDVHDHWRSRLSRRPAGALHAGEVVET